MLKVFEPEALNYFTFSRPILLTLFVSRNPILAHLLCGFSALRSDRTHSQSGILSPDATHASGGVIIFDRQGLSCSELSTSSLCSIPTPIMLGSTSLLITPPRCHFFMCTSPLFAPLRRMAEPTPFLPPFFSPPEISSFWGTLIAITLSGTREVLPTPVGRKYLTGSSPLTSSPQ